MQNLDIKQANQSSSNYPLLQQPYDLAIIGSGISCAYTLIHFISRLKEKLSTNQINPPFQPVKVAVLDKSGEFWAGIPYGSRTGQQSLIITALREFLPQPERDRFITWLTNNYDAVFNSLQQRPGILTSQWLQFYQDAIAQGNWDKLFVPRYVFGWYIKDYVEQLLLEASKQEYLQCSLLSAEVLNIQKLSANYRLEFVSAVRDHSFLTAAKVVLAIGSPPNKFPFIEELEALEASSPISNVCFITNMYEPSQNSNIERIVQALKQSESPQQNQVLIIGSNASALETIYSLNNLPEAQDVIAKFVVISPNGEFPHRISNQPTATNFVPRNLIALSQSQHFTAKQILDSVKQDVALALEQGETIDGTYKVISKEIINSLNQLSFEEQKQFVIKYGVEIGKFQRRAGTDYLNVVDKLVFQGRLEFLKGKFVKLTALTPGKFGFEFITTDNQIEQFTDPIKVVINCAGFQNLNQSSSPLIRNLIQQDICTPNDSLCGFAMNEDFEANENLYLMGPLIAGNINAKFKVWHAESCGRIINLSQQLAEILI